MNQVAALANGSTARWLSVRLGRQDFAIDVGCVRELRRYSPITPVPQYPAFMLGLHEFRGTLIPVLDLGLRLGLSAVTAAEHSIIIVIQAQRGMIGLLVDQVCELLSLADDALHYLPSFSNDAKAAFVGGAISLDGRIISILRTENIVDVERLP